MALNYKITILGKGNVQGTTIPTSIQTWESKFEREIGEKIKFEGEIWTVISVGFQSMAAAKECMNGMADLYVLKGYWTGSKSFKPKF